MIFLNNNLTTEKYFQYIEYPLPNIILQLQQKLETGIFEDYNFIWEGNVFSGIFLSDALFRRNDPNFRKYDNLPKTALFKYFYLAKPERGLAHDRASYYLNHDKCNLGNAFYIIRVLYLPVVKLQNSYQLLLLLWIDFDAIIILDVMILYWLDDSENVWNCFDSISLLVSRVWCSVPRVRLIITDDFLMQPAQPRPDWGHFLS